MRSGCIVAFFGVTFLWAGVGKCGYFAMSSDGACFVAVPS